MCGNFGLLSLRPSGSVTDAASTHPNELSHHRPKIEEEDDLLDRSMNESMHRVSKLNGIRVRSDADLLDPKEPLNPLQILEAQTASTEIRGGQAGGYSTIEYVRISAAQDSSIFDAPKINRPVNTRVRMVARKRHPLAADLTTLYMRQRLYKPLNPKSTITVIGHTRFATSSRNLVPELHPHEWVPFHDETVWLFNAKEGKFERCVTSVGIHISHNGDFDAMEAYSQTMVNEEIGLWLERVLHVANDCKGDSPKIAGCMDLLRVQGRWAAAARLAWVRCVLTSTTDVSSGVQLSKSAPNSFPSQPLWDAWAKVLEFHWEEHIGNIIKVIESPQFDTQKMHFYRIDQEGVSQFIRDLSKSISSNSSVGQRHHNLGVEGWNHSKLTSFLHHAVRGFLRGDLYTAMTELLSRAEGSFGLQAHCSLEPGVVVIASKGQPMSFAFDNTRPIVLFASEASALSVPVYKSGKWLPERIDLDSHGEIFRLGFPKSLLEGRFGDRSQQQAGQGGLNFNDIPLVPMSSSWASDLDGAANSKPAVTAATKEYKRDEASLRLDCGVEIRGYSLVTCTESTVAALTDRVVLITTAPVPYDPKVDLVAADLKVTPAILETIDQAWFDEQSIERQTGQALAESLVKSMQRRIVDNKDTTDLIIGGVEVSLWLGEQFAADLRRIFPNLNVTTVSTNKLLGLGDDNPSKVFFSGADEVLSRRIDENTCVLLISQSGQTFPTLHATRKLASKKFDKLWILTGCFNSKMEQALTEGYRERGIRYNKNRVFNNYSGHRPAEPSSVAVAATWHTLTRLLLHVVDVSRSICPGGRVIHPWDIYYFATVVTCFMVKARYLLKRKGAAYFINKQVAVSSPGSLVSTASGLNVSKAALLRQQSKGQRRTSFQMSKKGSNPQVVTNLTDGCIADMHALINESLIANISDIVGYDVNGDLIHDPTGENFNSAGESSNQRLVKQGIAWAEHINETWHMLVLVGIYLFFSVGFGLPIFGLIADAILAIIRAGLGSSADQLGNGVLMFTPRTPSVMRDQGIGYTLIGLLVQCIDAVFFIYLAKNFTRWTRLLHGRPLAARHGKRTLVIVDTPCVHQLVEIFVSKLFAQSYSMVSIDVHGASGLDHFVHRFTHRVVRGLLIAVGRPDGRLSCLAKSEASILLSAKQAAFIRNPDYEFEGAGPEIVTIGHNPYEPNLGLAYHIVLHNSGNKSAISVHGSSGIQSSHGGYDSIGSASSHNWGSPSNRRKFVDEYIYDRLFLAKKPFTYSMLRSLRLTFDSTQQAVVSSRSSKRSTIGNISNHSRHSRHSRHGTRSNKSRVSTLDGPLPYGVHHIDPVILAPSAAIENSLFSDFIQSNIEMLKPSILDNANTTGSTRVTKSNDPAVRLAFSSKLDAMTRQIQDLQVNTQQFYECRVASLERYMAFCVMFHAMAKACAKPWLLTPWDIARSQSNLRVATTAYFAFKLFTWIGLIDSVLKFITESTFKYDICNLPVQIESVHINFADGLIYIYNLSIRAPSYEIDPRWHNEEIMAIGLIEVKFSLLRYAYSYLCTNGWVTCIETASLKGVHVFVEGYFIGEDDLLGFAPYDPVSPSHANQSSRGKGIGESLRALFGIEHVDGRYDYNVNLLGSFDRDRVDGLWTTYHATTTSSGQQPPHDQQSMLDSEYEQEDDHQGDNDSTNDDDAATGTDGFSSCGSDHGASELEKQPKVGINSNSSAFCSTAAAAMPSNALVRDRAAPSRGSDSESVGTQHMETQSIISQVTSSFGWNAPPSKSIHIHQQPCSDEISSTTSISGAASRQAIQRISNNNNNSNNNNTSEAAGVGSTWLNFLPSVLRSLIHQGAKVKESILNINSRDYYLYEDHRLNYVRDEDLAATARVHFESIVVIDVKIFLRRVLPITLKHLERVPLVIPHMRFVGNQTAMDWNTIFTDYNRTLDADLTCDVVPSTGNLNTTIEANLTRPAYPSMPSSQQQIAPTRPRSPAELATSLTPPSSSSILFSTNVFATTPIKSSTMTYYPHGKLLSANAQAITTTPPTASSSASAGSINTTGSSSSTETRLDDTLECNSDEDGMDLSDALRDLSKDLAKENSPHIKIQSSSTSIQFTGRSITRSWAASRTPRAVITLSSSCFMLAYACSIKVYGLDVVSGMLHGHMPLLFATVVVVLLGTAAWNVIEITTGGDNDSLSDPEVDDLVDDLTWAEVDSQPDELASDDDQQGDAFTHYASHTVQRRSRRVAIDPLTMPMNRWLAHYAGLDINLRGGISLVYLGKKFEKALQTEVLRANTGRLLFDLLQPSSSNLGYTMTSPKLSRRDYQLKQQGAAVATPSRPAAVASSTPAIQEGDSCDELEGGDTSPPPESHQVKVRLRYTHRTPSPEHIRAVQEDTDTIVVSHPFFLF